MSIFGSTCVIGYLHIFRFIQKIKIITEHSNPSYRKMTDWSVFYTTFDSVEDSHLSQTEKTNNHESKIAARKKSIIDAAVQLFSERDFHEVRIDDIAEKVGLAKGTIYLYFENKDQLFLSIIIERTRTLKESLEKASE